MLKKSEKDTSIFEGKESQSRPGPQDPKTNRNEKNLSSKQATLKKKKVRKR